MFCNFFYFGIFTFWLQVPAWLCTSSEQLIWHRTVECTKEISLQITKCLFEKTLKKRIVQIIWKQFAQIIWGQFVQKGNRILAAKPGLSFWARPNLRLCCGPRANFRLCQKFALPHLLCIYLHTKNMIFFLTIFWIDTLIRFWALRIAGLKSLKMLRHTLSVTVCCQFLPNYNLLCCPV